ncbi:MAG TPA: beta-ketoacyl synthase N-terminal-like domain-containing protein, partial [Kofleriaceae bacterium]|nr:beta-ketoacyl synthase N-terminal-like domain-containing protein [Kofleriaceae bacterium]
MTGGDAGGDVVLVDAVRTPRGKGSARGALHALAPLELVTGLLDALVARGLDPAAVDDVVLGCASQIGEQGGNLARTAVLRAGWKAPVPGVTINRFCASGLDAVNLAAARIRAGDADAIVAGGVESVSRVPLFADDGPLWHEPTSIHMGVAADAIATLEGFTR